MTMVWLYDKPENENFQNKLEKVQYKACFAVTDASQEISRWKCYDQLGLHSQSKRSWHGKLIFLYEVINGFLSKCLYSYLTFPSQENYPLRWVVTTQISSRIKSFKNFFSLLHKWM